MWPFRGRDYVLIERINGRKVNLKLRVGAKSAVDLPNGQRVEFELSEERKRGKGRR